MSVTAGVRDGNARNSVFSSQWGKEILGSEGGPVCFGRKTPRSCIGVVETVRFQMGLGVNEKHVLNLGLGYRYLMKHTSGEFEL